MSNRLCLLALLIVVLIFGGEKEARQAIAYFALVYVGTELPFILFAADLKIPFSAYLWLLSLCSLITVALYTSLNLTWWLLGALLCEAVLMALFMALFMRVPVLVEWRLELIWSINLVEMGLLMGNWINGKFARNRTVHPRLWNLGADVFAARASVHDDRAQGALLVEKTQRGPV